MFKKGRRENGKLTAPKLKEKESKSLARPRRRKKEKRVPHSKREERRHEERSKPTFVSPFENHRIRNDKRGRKSINSGRRR